MPLPIRRLAPRNISITGANKTLKPVSQKETQEKYFVRLVEGNRNYDMLIECMQNGIPVTTIAAHFAEQQWIEVNERTFAEALRVFKRKKPSSLTVKREGLAEHIEPNQPAMPVEQQLQQLINLQTKRLAIQYGLEKTAGILFGNTHRDVDATNKLIENLAKIQGKIIEGGRGHDQITDADISADLNKVRKDTNTSDRLHGMVRQVVETTS